MKKKFANYPPPNNYNPKSNLASSAAFTFGSSQRHSMSLTNLKTPAPNAYDLINKSLDKGPSFHMGLKCDN